MGVEIKKKIKLGKADETDLRRPMKKPLTRQERIKNTRKQQNIKKILEDQPLKEEREKIGLTEREKNKAINIGKGKKTAIKTKEAVKNFGVNVIEGANKIRKKIGDFSQMEKGFYKEMLGLKKGGPVDARKIAKKYFKGTF